MFERAVITPVGGEPVTVEAPGASLASKYVQSARLGAEPLDRPWFTHDQLFKAGDVTFEMGPLANESWGADPKAAPPSISTHPVSAFGCPARPAPPKVQTGLTLIVDKGHVRGARLFEAASPEVGIADQQIDFFYDGVFVRSAVTGADGVAPFKPAKNKAPDAYEARYAGNDRYMASSSRAL